MGSSASIDFSLSNMYHSWYAFRRGKRVSPETITFQYALEPNLIQLQQDLIDHRYRHGGYAYFTVHDSKKRDIAVAHIRDRVIHRLAYDYLVPLWNEHFIFDAWSCRVDKGQHRALERAADYMRRYSNGWVWRTDITKFFDSIDQELLFSFIARRVTDPNALWLIREILRGYYKHEAGRGMPIGNLTSQIFANIYLNELDRYIVHTLKPAGYLRYGDDWLCFSSDKQKLSAIRERAKQFLECDLKLRLSKKLDILVPVQHGIMYLGLDLWPNGSRITGQTIARADTKINNENFASYEALIRTFSSDRRLKQFYWQYMDSI
jgi:RNA-directed DNA polymerase